MRKASGLRHRVTLYEYVYQMLTENEMIETMCGQYFKTAQHHGDMGESVSYRQEF
jgi:hypothetical protein